MVEVVKKLFDGFVDGIMKSFDWSSKTNRIQFFGFLVFAGLISLGLVFIDQMFIGKQLIQPIFSFLILVPYLGNFVRRCNDINKSRWFVLLLFIPLVSFIVTIIFGIKESSR